MQLKKIKRAEKKGTESVMDEKFALLFQSSFAVGHGDLVFSVSNSNLSSMRHQTYQLLSPGEFSFFYLPM